MTDLDYLKQVVGALEASYVEMQHSPQIGQPIWISETVGFRYPTHSDLLLIYLKGVRWISILNASFWLLSAGYTQEIGILFRCMDESLEDMLFFAEPQGAESALSKNQLRAFAEFFQEQIEDPENIRPIKRDRVPRKKVRAGIFPPGKIPEEAKGMEAIGIIYDAFSGFVHGAYPHIMDAYGGKPPRHHMSGMLGTPLIKGYEEQLVNYVFRAVLGAELVAGRLGEEAISEELFQLKSSLEERFPQLIK